MEGDQNHGEIGAIMEESHNVDVNAMQGNLSGSGTTGVTDETASTDKSDKETLIPIPQDLAYPESVLAQPSLPQPVIVAEGAEPMDQSSDQTLPTIAMALASENNQKLLEKDGHINQAWFTTKEDKDNLQGKGVKWRQGMWGKDEIDLLKRNISDYCKTRGIANPHDVIFKQSKDERKSFYRTIAKGIHRPLFAIYRRVLRTYENGNYIGKYSPDEVELLKELRKKHSNDWTAIGLALGRSASSVKDRCRLLKEKCTSGKWRDEEEKRLSSAVHQVTSTKPGESVTTGILWTNVAKMVGTRSEKQCRSKWLNYLNWKECGGKEWNKTDEIDLIKKIYDLGLENENEIDWAALANGWASVRSPQWLRSKWWIIKKHVPSSPNMSFRDIIAYLHSNYAKNLRNRLDRRDPRYLQIPPTDQEYPVQGFVTTNVGQTVSVDGEIFMTRDDDKGTDGLNSFEMVQLRALPNTDPSQPTSYILEPIHCSITGPASSYILHQASPHAGTKLVKLTGSCNIARQVMGDNDAGANMQHENLQDCSIITTPVVVTTSTQVSHAHIPNIVTTETLQEGAASHVGQGISTEDTRESYMEKNNDDTIEDHHQRLDCLTGPEMSAMSDQGKGNCEEFENGEICSHQTVEKEKADQCTSLASVCSQSIDINFPTSDSSIYSHPLIPDLVSSAQTSSSQFPTNEVLTPQPTLPDNILQSQGDEPGFLSDSVMTVHSPLSMVAGSLGEVTVSNTSHDLPSNGLILDSEFHITGVPG